MRTTRTEPVQLGTGLTVQLPSVRVRVRDFRAMLLATPCLDALAVDLCVWRIGERLGERGREGA